MARLGVAQRVLVPLRVVLVAPMPPPYGGIGKWTKELLAFTHSDADIEFIHVCSSQRFRSMLNIGFLSRIASGIPHGIDLFASFISALLRKRAQVVHMTTSGSLAFLRDILFIASARVLGTSTVLHLRNGRLPHVIASGTMEASLAKWACRLAGAVIVLDPASAEAVRKLAPACPVSIIPNPAWTLGEPVPAEVAGSGIPTVVFVGWVIPAKGVYELVRACTEISDIPFHLEMLGIVKDEVRAELAAIAAARDGGSWLNIPGEVSASEVAARISGSSMLVLPSYTEGAPNVVLEAMALGTPVIATPVGAVPEMLGFDSPRPCGLKVAVRDTNTLRDAIRSLLLNPAVAAEFGSRGRKRAIREYAPASVIARYKSVWRETAARVARRLEPVI